MDRSDRYRQAASDHWPSRPNYINQGFQYERGKGGSVHRPTECSIKDIFDNKPRGIWPLNAYLARLITRAGI